jgi:hypothetical protein
MRGQEDTYEVDNDSGLRLFVLRSCRERATDLEGFYFWRVATHHVTSPFFSWFLDCGRAGANKQ